MRGERLPVTLGFVTLDLHGPAELRDVQELCTLQDTSPALPKPVKKAKAYADMLEDAVPADADPLEVMLAAVMEEEDEVHPGHPEFSELETLAFNHDLKASIRTLEADPAFRKK